MNWVVIENDKAFEDVLNGYIVGYKPVFETMIEKKIIAVQAGGYCGIFPRMLSYMFNWVYTFEPDHDNFFCLTNNCMDRKNIVKTQGGLGNSSQKIKTTQLNSENRGMIVSRYDSAGIIPVHKIDDLNLFACDLIQLDTEGFEYEILNGASVTIEKFKPFISVEDTNKNIIDFLSIRGYREVAKVYRDTMYSAK
jgi:FkbM family methyltransferase